jgi:hypothetical protein
MGRRPFAGLLCALLACSSGAGAVGTTKVAPGTWGGEHLILEVTAQGAQFEFDCAQGRLDGPLVVDARGALDQKGTFTPEHGGPVRRDEETPKSDARYAGRIDGDTMTLTVSRAGAEVGSFSLKRGARPPLRKCR